MSGPEVIAIAAHCGKMWPAAVTGVDYDKQELLGEFLVDGTRSLLSRGLAVEKDGHIALDARLGDVLKPVFSSTVICAFVGTADDVAEIVGGAIYVYPDGEACIVEVARATGQRELLGLDKSAAVRLLRMFAESVFRSSQGENDPSDLALYVGAPVGPELPVTIVRPGRLSHGIAPKAGGPVVSVQEAQRWDSDWILRLFDPVAIDPD
ncbi:hypothetical protein GCM10023346_21210 [Arthrobacter gyeryongensis]|uniref:Uncharacterized protein n=1 Tax=Arthrobacter gyeryongensis TaxID=1650592 RepID=A0ABP9SCM0_9MICC